MAQKLSEKALKNKKAYTKDYANKNYRNFRFDVRYDDTEVLDKLNSVENKQAYILGLIREDIKKGK